MKIISIPEVKCPNCGETYTMATASVGAPPKPLSGNWAMCFHCGELLTFNQNLAATIPPPEQLDGLKQRNPTLYNQIMAIQATLRKKFKTEQN